jgi:hypothetical protein
MAKAELFDGSKFVFAQLNLEPLGSLASHCSPRFAAFCICNHCSKRRVPRKTARL